MAGRKDCPCERERLRHYTAKAAASHSIVRAVSGHTVWPWIRIEMMRA